MLGQARPRVHHLDSRGILDGREAGPDFGSRRSDPQGVVEHPAQRLVQPPPRSPYGPGLVRHLGRLSGKLDPLPLVVELHHRSWFERAGLRVLRGLRYSLAYVDVPEGWNRPPRWHPPTGPVGYLRAHGRNEADWPDPKRRHDYRYASRGCAALVERAARVAREVDTMHVSYCNHVGGQALADAVATRALLLGTAVPSPHALLEAYPDLASATPGETSAGTFG